MPMRPAALLLAVLLAAGCAAPRQPIGAFPERLAAMQLGHVVVVADRATRSPVSRDATPEEWQAALDKAFRDRFGRNEGARWYHFGLHVDGYALAPPGIPLVASPRSVLIVSATIWDDEKGGKLNDTPHQITVFESLSGATALGSGLFKSREDQLEALAFNAALEVERWLLENPQWFPEAAPVDAPVDAPADAAAAAAPPADAVVTTTLAPPATAAATVRPPRRPGV
jgi:hypothetical protein